MGGRVPEGAGGQQASLFPEKTASPLWPILSLTREIIQLLHTQHTHLGRSDGVIPNTIFIGMDGGRETQFTVPWQNMVLYFG